MRVKLCGITRLEDALMALELGVWALGFNFYPGSPRCLGVAAARALIQELPPSTVTVGVFVNESAEEVARIQRETGVKLVQLHGQERVEEFRGFSGSLIKALRTEEDFERAGEWARCGILLVDAYSKAQFGGTGQCADWTEAGKLAQAYPVILAGGLQVANVQEAIAAVRPYAVDLCSGVEVVPGVKSKQKLKELLMFPGLRCAPSRLQFFCHPERSEGS